MKSPLVFPLSRSAAGSRNIRAAMFSTLLGCLVLCGLARAENLVQATYYAAPDGKGTAGTQDAPCSLTGVRDLVRTVSAKMTGDIIVNLRGGTYALTAPFELIEDATTHDSGINGFNIIYQAAPGETPVFSGGVTISGWTLHDPAKQIYQAKVPAGTRSRQLYVDDRHAVRARSALKPAGWTRTDTGWTITDVNMEKWGNPDDIEVVSRSSWKHLRCGIASITGATVTMKMPGWANASKSPKPGNPFNGGGTQEMKTVEWLENAYELLDEPGEWYLDSKAGLIYYIPTPEDDMASASTVLAVQETLLNAHGADFDHRLHNVQFRGITFAHATWMQPSGPQGYADNQAGVVWLNIPPVSGKTPGGVSFQYASDIRFERNVICHMGGAALDFGHGPQRNAIIGNCIYDISGNGIFLGEVDDYQATDPKAWCDNNIIQNNYITRVGEEFEDQVGICTGYTRLSLLDHNEIFDCPYSGISVGWGWSKLGYSHQNTISHNEVHSYMHILGDGGGIYTLGNQGTAEERTIWDGNYIHHSGHAQGMYADEGSGFMEIKNNVIHNIGVNWINIWTKTIHDINVHSNFSDKTNIKNNGTNCIIENNEMAMNPKQMPEAALAIVKNAGLQPEFADIKTKIPPPAQEMVNDNDNAITYTGKWIASGGRNFGDYGNDVHASNAPDATATFTFRGRAVDCLMEFNKDEGEVNFSVDGVFAKTVDCKTPDRLAQQVAFHQTWPESGEHTIKIERKTPGYIVLDAFRIYHRLPRAK